MSTEFLVFVTVLLGLLTALLGVIRELRGLRTEGKATHDLINSRMEQLLKVYGANQRAEGVVEGRKDRTD